MVREAGHCYITAIMNYLQLCVCFNNTEWLAMFRYINQLEAGQTQYIQQVNDLKEVRRQFNVFVYKYLC